MEEDSQQEFKQIGMFQLIRNMLSPGPTTHYHDSSYLVYFAIFGKYARSTCCNVFHILVNFLCSCINAI